jgi:indolepyruvate ferredoxin oxidoreductase
MSGSPLTLEDKYVVERGRVYLTGVQALVRLLLLQADRDRAAGLNTAGFVSGYRGSPLGALDRALVEAGAHLAAHDVRFQPGVNEELAATAVWGTQQLDLFPRPRVEGVFALWYGKGPGVDRCGDVFKHANYAGTSRHGGVLVVAGDDHSAKSSAVAHQSEHQFAAAAIPVLAPADLQEVIDFGLHGWAMSRYSGCWVAMKLAGEVAESSATVEIDPARVAVRLPESFPLPSGGVSLRWPDPPLVQERRMQEYKVYAALAYARANGLDRTVIDSPRARFGILTCGKAYRDVLQALEDLGIDAAEAARIGIRLYKAGVVWPLEAEGVRRFAAGLEEILVVEEKRQILEYQLKEQLYNWREDVRPRVIGKFDDRGEWGEHHGAWLLPPTAELEPAVIARAIAARIARFHASPGIDERLACLDAKARALSRPRFQLARTPWFCPGCPHNTSTKVPAGSCALGGVGCHLMAVWMGRDTLTISQMGGEGASWVGAAPYSGTSHVFANMGDGTYFHSGLLAVRAAVVAGVNITYKLLYNDAVAMTGGQPIDGPLTVPQITRQLADEGVRRIVVIADEPAHYGPRPDFAAGVEIRPRADLERVQRALREAPGVTVLLYDQLCATEKRRRIKRGAHPAPARYAYINELVCDDCGDCGAKSNCLALVPVDTPLGEKRRIDASSCTDDLACVEGFCPSFVIVRGGARRRRTPRPPQGAPPPEPARPATDRPYGILVTGIGGSGVVTLGALLGMAAHLEGKGVTVLDQTGLSQKAGAVYSHVRIADRQDAIHAARIATGEAHALIGGDLVVSAANEALERVQAGLTRAVVNEAKRITGEMIAQPEAPFPAAAMKAQIETAVGNGHAEFLDATRLAEALCGDSLGTNMLLLGYAWQRGLVPLGEASIDRAIELNGAAVEANRAAFAWGRRAAADLAAVEAAAGIGPAPPESLDRFVAVRVAELTGYQDAAYARRYQGLVDAAREAERALAGSAGPLAAAVASAYYRLLAVKDEYEVARLYTDGRFEAAVSAAFEGDYAIEFRFAPAGLASPDPVTGEPPKRAFGAAWTLPALRVLARMRRLRGTGLDPFAGSAERRRDQALLAEYEATLNEVLASLRPETYPTAVALARLPDRIRGFGPVRARAVAAARAERARLLETLRGTAAAAASA